MVFDILLKITEKYILFRGYWSKVRNYLWFLANKRVNISKSELMP